MMEVFRDSQPDFYVSYFTARVIIDRSATRPGEGDGCEPGIDDPSRNIRIQLTNF
jgi:hypothetical protein